MKKFIYSMIIIFIFCSITGFTYKKPEYKGAVLIETNTGKVLYGYNKDKILPQASITKLMTYYTFKELLAQKSIKEDDKIVINVNKFNIPNDASQIHLKKGDVLSLRQLIDTMLIVSAGDSAAEIQNIYDKNNKSIVNSMNENAKKLGLYKSHFVNVTGITSRNNGYKKYNVTTAYEIALLTKDIIHKYPEVLKTTSISEYKYKNKTLKNTNTLLTKMPGVDGLKTGYTEEAGYCLASTENVTSKIGNGKKTRLVAVVLGCPTDAARIKESINLLKYGEDNFINDRVITKYDIIKINNELYKGDYINGIINTNVYFLRNKKDKILKKIQLNKDLPNTINKGDKIGKITITLGNEKVEKYLYAQKSYKIKPLYKRIFIYIKNFFKSFLTL